ncbi:hypothetical protein SCWH03_06830 [Streptomyces pacificus]|uniref:Uncharacterized protein n=1 Tax=Streptomyces pacificus TaxID=2705029 RepID=A0A6A0ANC2_9ACTN|nr:hypothetical protein SCWH03_06830 [Streptomyces pacificus]
MVDRAWRTSFSESGFEHFPLTIRRSGRAEEWVRNNSYSQISLDPASGERGGRGEARHEDLGMRETSYRPAGPRRERGLAGWPEVGGRKRQGPGARADFGRDRPAVAGRRDGGTAGRRDI